MTKRILHVVTNVAHYADSTQPTGLWLSELTHAYEIFAARGYQQRLVSPRGGESPLEPRALRRVRPLPHDQHCDDPAAPGRRDDAESFFIGKRRHDFQMRRAQD